MFKSDFYAKELKVGLGRNSAASLLSHELFHTFNAIDDRDGYDSRNRNTSMFKEGTTFRNEEEEYTTKFLQNQVNSILRESKRINYGINRYFTINPTTVTPLEP